MTTQELIARLEKATGPDRALWDEVNDHAWKAHWIDTARHLVNRTLIEQAFALPDGNLLIAVALTLVPDGGYPLVGKIAPDKWRAHLGFGNRAIGQMAEAPIPATALCIVALRARATGTQP